MPDDFTYMWKLKKKKQKKTTHSLIDTENKLVVTRWEGGLGGGGER